MTSMTVAAVAAELVGAGQDLVLGPEAGEAGAGHERRGADMKVQKVHGMTLRRPPMSFFMSKEWMWWASEPEPRNRQALKMAWVKRWKMAAVQAPTPRAITM